MKTLRLSSGTVGWQGHLREVYSSWREFEDYCRIYNIHTRLGYKTTVGAWRSDPLIQGSVNPGDLKRVRSVKQK